MNYARHFPTREFSQTEALAMPRLKAGDMAPDGWSYALDRAGKAIAVWVDYDLNPVRGFAVRPIVRVKAGRAYMRQG